VPRGRRAAAEHERRGHGHSAIDRVAAKQTDEHPPGEDPLLANRLTNRREVGQLRQRVVVDADHRHIARHIQPRSAQRPDGARPTGALGPVAASVRLPGVSGPLDGCAAAEVLLAGRSSDEIRALWIDGYVETRHASIDELERDLERVRVEGWASDDADEPVLASRAVAAPIRDPDGSVVAAVSLDLTARRDANLPARAVVGAASRISAAMRQCEAS
jgi:hypothetical protein